MRLDSEIELNAWMDRLHLSPKQKSDVRGLISVITEKYSESSGKMKMRDYIAIKAMQGLLANPAYAEATFEQWANMAYSAADAMIKRSEIEE